MHSFLKLIGLVFISLHVHLSGITQMTNYQNLTIHITDGNNHPLSGVKVQLVPTEEGKGEVINQAEPGKYRKEEVIGGTYMVKVSCPGYERQSRTILVDDSHHRERFYLGKPGSDYTYSGGALLPFKGDPYTLGITFRKDSEEGIKASLKDLDLEWTISGSSGYAILRSKSPLPATNNNKLATLREMEGIAAAGPIFSNELRMAIFGQYILVTFKTSTSRQKREEILDTHGLKVTRKLYGQTYLLEIPGDLGLGLNQLLDALMNNSQITTVDPNLIPVK